LTQRLRTCFQSIKTNFCFNKKNFSHSICFCTLCNIAAGTGTDADGRAPHAAKDKAWEESNKGAGHASAAKQGLHCGGQGGAELKFPAADRMADA
jgi:hypothetical protein